MCRKLILLMLCLFLAACGRQVQVVQPKQFKLMADHLPKELIARDILDDNRDYMAGIWDGTSSNYGNLLYTRLMADFVFGEVAINLKGKTFADLVKQNPEENSVHLRPQGFGFVSIKKNKKSNKKSSISFERRVDVEMIAITDWDGDGQKDWLISGKLLKSIGAVPRIFYVVVPNPSEYGMLRGNVVAVYDDMGAFGRLYMGAGAAPSTGQVEDVVPGLKPVTTPPSKESNSNNSSVKERELD